MAIAAMAAFNLTAADLAGTWKGSMNTQAGDTQVMITIKPGTTLVGKVQAGDYEADITNGKVSGDEISFEMKIGPGTVSYQGKVTGDEMRLDVVGVQGNQYKLICKRANR